MQTFYSVWLGWDWSTRFSFAAMLIALMTLFGVAAQIILARRELHLVKADLEQNKRMIDEALKHPELFLTFRNGQKNARVIDARPNFTSLMLQNALEVTNRGERTAHNVYIEVYVPRTLVPNPAQFRDTIIEDVDHVVIGGELNNVALHPMRAPSLAFGDTTYNIGLYRFKERQLMRWRLFDDYGIHPGGFGTLYLDPPKE